MYFSIFYCNAQLPFLIFLRIVTVRIDGIYRVCHCVACHKNTSFSLSPSIVVIIIQKSCYATDIAWDMAYSTAVGTANAFIPWILACAAANGTENFAFPKAFWTLFHIKRLLKLFALLDFHMRGAGLHSD